MQDSDYINELKNIVLSNKKNFIQILTAKKYNYSYLLKFINEKTPLLNDPQYMLCTKIKWILDDLHDFPICEVCGKQIGIGMNIGPFKAYPKCCSIACSNRSISKQEKIKQACLEKYGVDNVSKSDNVKKKIVNTFIEKYGENCPLKNSEIKEKAKITSIEKYGVDRYQKSNDFKLQLKNAWKNKTTEEKNVAKNKYKITCLEKYGVEYASQSDEVKSKMKNNLIEKYGENYKQILWGKNGNIGQNKRAYNNYILKSSLITPLFSEEEYISKKQSDKYFSKFKFQCKKCNTIFESYWDNGHAKCCPHCNLNGGTSKKEKEIFNFVSSVVSCKNNDRKMIQPLELDIYIPEKNIAIEFDGLYWHSDESNPDKHIYKTELCEKQNIHLIHIFENEWDYKQDIVKSRLKNILGLSENKIYARNCTIKEIDSKTSKEFQEENHIQGACGAKIHLGLFYNDELVSLMTFSKPRFDKKHDWELVRFCNKLNYNVVGGASKLLKYFEKNYNPKNIVSYADRRWTPNFNNNLYEKLGFKLDHISPPDYWYWKNNTILESRIKYQKHKLANILENFESKKTEVENMLDNGYNRIFDCGNLVYVKKY